ncbi:MAG: RtcB family protein [Elusimicrobiales bacterium]
MAIRRVDPFTILIDKDHKNGMKTDVVIYADEEIEKGIENQALIQALNVATLPGVAGRVIVMPDIHKGYGFPIGGVAAFDIDNGIISPGGIGYDINCGVRLLATSLRISDIEKKKKDITSHLYRNIPLGVGSEGYIKLSDSDWRQVIKKGARWSCENGFGTEEDLKFIESKGSVLCEGYGVSRKAKERGENQLGTLGSGNHFVEVSFVDELYDEKVAYGFGLEKGMVCVMIHTGSRGFGHQIATEYTSIMLKASEKYGIKLYDRELACAPFRSDEGQRYFDAMCSAANFAWANRQILKHLTEKALLSALSISKSSLSLRTVYDVAHNIAKIEEHPVGGVIRRVVVHRKGATRAFAGGSLDIPDDYREFGQPVIIPGDMGRYSYVLVGLETAVEKSFASSCHGAGRLLSRTKAIESSKGRDIRKELEEKGISVMANSKATLAEEIPDAYKDVSRVVDVVDRALISKKVARLKPLCVIKG